MKKDAEDIREIAEVKKVKAEKLCGGGKAKKYADGGVIEAITEGAKKIKENVMGTPEQNAAAEKRLDKIAKEPSMIGSIERGVRDALYRKGDEAKIEAKPYNPNEPKQYKPLKKGGKC